MATARERGLALSQTLEFNFRRRYRLPPTDPRFLDCTLEMMLIDHWAHRHWDDPKLKDEIIATDYDADVAEMEAEAEAREQAAKLRSVPESDWEEI